MKKLLILNLIFISILYSAIDYFPNYLIQNNSQGINLNLTTWKWKSNSRELRDLQSFNEIWLYSSYYFNNRYSVNLRYKHFMNDLSENKDEYGLEACYAISPLKSLVNRNTLRFDPGQSDEANKFYFSSNISFQNKIFFEYLKLSYLIGLDHSINDDKTSMINSFTLSLVSEKDAFEYYFAYWMRDEYSDDKTYIGLGINLFIPNKEIKK